MALCTDISERQMHVLIIINMKNDFASSPSRNLSQTISGGDQQWYTFARFCNIIASETKLQKKVFGYISDYLKTILLIAKMFLHL